MASSSRNTDAPDNHSSDPGSHQIIQALQKASAAELLALLLRFGLAEAFIRHIKEREIVFNHPSLSDPSFIQDQAFDQYCTQNNLQTEDDRLKWCFEHGMKRSDMLSEAIHAYRRKELREELVTASGETLFLRYKDKLDRVLYSLLRVEDPFHCQELFYSIEAGELTFAEAATLYSNGPESKTQGIVGPVDLTTPHPEIAARLRVAQAGHLIGPFQADQWHTIIRMEYRFDSEYNDATKTFLEDVCFKSQIGADLEPLLTSLASLVKSH